MKKETQRAFVQMMKECNEAIPEGESANDHAERTFAMFEKGINKFIAEGDIDKEQLAMIAAGLELTANGARTAEVRAGMHRVMLAIADYCFKDEKRPEVITLLNEKRKGWQGIVDEIAARKLVLKTLSPDDIINAKPLEKQPHE